MTALQYDHTEKNELNAIDHLCRRVEGLVHRDTERTKYIISYSHICAAIKCI